MPKIKVEIEVPSGGYCENEDIVCRMCLWGNRGICYCCLFNVDLEIDEENSNYCIRCDKCKQAELKDETIQD